MRTRVRQMVVGATAVVAAAAIAASALGMMQRDSTTDGPSQSAPTIASNFSALTNAALPQPSSAVIADFAALHPGITSERQIGTNESIADYDGAICAMIIPGSGGCTDHLDNGVWLMGTMIRASDTSSAPFNVNLYGAAEDGITALVFTLSNETTVTETTVTVPVVNNGFDQTINDTTFNDITGIEVVSTNGQEASLDPGDYFPTSAPTFNH